jgi:hypothetical protein
MDNQKAKLNQGRFPGGLATERLNAGQSQVSGNPTKPRLH